MLSKLGELRSAAHITAPISYDPLRNDSGLAETTLTDLSVFALTSSLSCVFDLRLAPQFADKETIGVLILQNVSKLTVDHTSRKDRTLWLVGDSRVHGVGGISALRVELRGMFGGAITAEAASAEFLAGNVEGIGPGPAAIDFDDLTGYLRSIPGWNSDFQITGRSFLEYPDRA